MEDADKRQRRIQHFKDLAHQMMKQFFDDANQNDRSGVLKGQISSEQILSALEEIEVKIDKLDRLRWKIFCFVQFDRNEQYGTKFQRIYSDIIT